MEFKAEFSDKNELIVKPIIEKKGKDLIIHVPSLKLIKELKENGKRNIQ
jgi:hypothetical protein